MLNLDVIRVIVLEHYAHVQAVYLFGSFATGQVWAESDVDIALLLPPVAAQHIGSLSMSDLRFELETQRIQRAREEHQLADDSFVRNHSRQDAAILNITRACEQSIDLANYFIKQHFC